jgi:hypothetical protein
MKAILVALMKILLSFFKFAATLNVQNSDNLLGTYTFEKGESYEWDRDPLLVRNQTIF